MELIKNITWNNLNGTKDDFKQWVNNYAKEFNVHVTNLVINNDSVSFTTYSKLPYKEVVNKLIAERYTIQDELAIQRKHQKGVNEAEFEEYDTYVEECKVQAKEWVTNRDKILQ